MTQDSKPESLDIVAELASIPEYVEHGASLALELALHAFERTRIAAMTFHGRGNVVPLLRTQRVRRALYLAGLCTIDDLDPYVRRDGAEKHCPDIFYRLKDYNGGKDPTAAHPADVWYETDKQGVRHERRTGDCISAAAWIGGWDRYQPQRFGFYSGWINTDSMRMDAAGPAKCFARIHSPESGCYVVAGSGSRGHAIGHIGTIIGGCDDFDASKLECWQALEVVDIASRGKRPANQLTTGRGWYDCDAYFVVPVMKP